MIRAHSSQPPSVMQDKRAQPSVPLILFHGLLSSPQEFGLIAHSLRSKGIAHQAITIPGYTLAMNDPTRDWRRWRDSAVEVIQSSAPGDQPFFLGGLCAGGILAAATALQMPERVAGLILMSPPFAYDGWGLSPIRHLRHLGYWTRLDRFFSVSEREPFGIKNPRIRKWVMRELQERDNSAVGPARIPLRALREAERMLAAILPGLAGATFPVLIIHSAEDEITQLSSVQRVFDALPLRHKELAVLEDSYHMVTIDNARHQVVNTIDDFLTGLAKRSSLARRYSSPTPENCRPATRNLPDVPEFTLT
jgi:carboxylesterase